MPDHAELIARLEAATEGSRELDALVWAAILPRDGSVSPLPPDDRWSPLRLIQGYHWEYDTRSDGLVEFFAADEKGRIGFAKASRFAPNYTTSIDAALTLVPEGMTVDLHIGPRQMGNDAIVYAPVKSLDEHGRRVTTYFPHEARAVREGVMHWTPAAVQLCIAALKARAA